MNRILATGGAGYVGSHTLIELALKGYELSVFDNLSNSNVESLDAVQKLTGQSISFIQGDVCSVDELERAFSSFKPDAVVHFAGLKSVRESCEQPLRYYHNNVQGTLNLLQTMQRHGCKKIVFSSSATVYGPTTEMPLTENSALGPAHAYAGSKLACEQMLTYLARADSEWCCGILRYFNPAGAHESGLLGEDPVGSPNNLIPCVSQVAAGQLPEVSIYGADYPTADGTGVRDYIHVMDLAQGHVAALQYIDKSIDEPLVVNLGMGRGYSVMDVIETFRQVSGQTIPTRICERRSGDLAEYYSSPKLALQKLGWRATRQLEDICRDAWNWQQRHPSGYRCI